VGIHSITSRRSLGLNVLAFLAVVAVLSCASTDGDSTPFPSIVRASPRESCQAGGSYQECVEAHDFTGSVLIAKDWEVLFEGGFGQADIDTGRLNTPDTVFRLASITKQFTATLVLLLQEDALLSVNDNVDLYFPQYPNGENITIHQLLTHTSGLPRYLLEPGISDMLDDPDARAEDTLPVIENLIPFYSPGEEFLYTNAGYILLGFIIEQVSGQPYERLVEERIFQPLGMMSSSFGTDDFSEPEAAFSYVEWSGQIDFFNHDRAFSTGSLVSSVKDLLIWDKALFSGEVLAPESLEQMFTVGPGFEGFSDQSGYGYGWHIGPGFWHDGSSPGYDPTLRRIIGINASRNSYWAEDGITIVVLSNQGMSGKTVKSLSDSLYKMATAELMPRE
jgi:CubicO group peptidase (beta-lactamase class C family)